MEGACSNQTVKCIVYTNNFELGKEKLLEIEKEKNDLGITTVVKRLLHYDYGYPNEIRFSDGEEWVAVKPNNGARGYRWRKAWIDVKTSYEQLVTCVLPYGDMYKWEEEKYFNWETHK